MSRQAATPRPFRASVGKDLLNNARWMILGFIGTTAALAISLTSTLQKLSPSFTAIDSLFPLCTLLCGFLLGCVSIVGENRGDGYGFLVHRPISRQQLFAAKATAGMLLYLGAVGIPLLLVTVWAAWPGHLPAPFDLLLLRGPFADMLCGAFAYFVGFLCSMREARWYATRWLALLSAIPLVTFVQSSTTFLLAIGSCTVGLIIAVLAARGAFVTGGGYQGQPLMARIATVLALASSLYMAGLFLYSPLVWVGSLVHGPTKPGFSFFDGPVNTLEVLPSGPVHVTKKAQQILSVTDISGKEIPTATYTRLKDSVSSDDLDLEGVGGSFGRRGYRLADKAYRLLETGDGQKGLLWYFVSRTRLVVGFDRKTKLVAAYVGPDGFTEPGVKLPRGFDGPLESQDITTFPSTNGGPRSSGVVLKFDSVVYTLNPGERVVEMPFSATSGEKVLRASQGRDGWLLVSTTKAIYLRAPFGVTTTVVPHPVPIPNYRSVTLYRILSLHPDAFYLSYRPREETFSSSGDSLVTAPGELLKFSLDGTLTDRYQIPGRLAGVRPRSNAFLEVASVLSSPSALSFYRFGLAPSRSRFQPRYSEWLVMFIVMLALLSGVITAVLARRHSFPGSRLLLWSAIGLILGPLGIALMAATIDWPICETCPNCKRRRVITQVLCEHCGHPFLPPAADGTEIFDPAFAAAA